MIATQGEKQEAALTIGPFESRDNAEKALIAVIPSLAPTVDAVQIVDEEEEEDD